MSTLPTSDPKPNRKSERPVATVVGAVRYG